MSEKQKTPRKRGKKVDINPKGYWKDIMRDIEMDGEYSIEVMDYIEIFLIDGTSINVDVTYLLECGADPEKIESDIQAKIKDLDDYVEDIRFFVNLDKVTDTVKTKTDKLLKDI